MIISRPLVPQTKVVIEDHVVVVNKYLWFNFLVTLIIPFCAVAHELEDVSSATEMLVWEGAQTVEQIDARQQARYNHLLENPINLATASTDELQELPGIGQVLANRIVEWREQNKLVNLQSLTEVKGISERLLARISPFISIASVQFKSRALVNNRYSGEVGLSILNGHGIGRDPGVVTEDEFTLPVAGFWRINDRSKGYASNAYLSYRQHTPIVYDFACGCFTIDEHHKTVRIDSVNVSGAKQHHAFLLGHYQMGLADRLVIDQTSRIYPQGLYQRISNREVLDKVKITSPDKLFGLAYQYNNNQARLHSANLYLSHTRPDIYQYDVRYAANSDQLSLLPVCSQAGQSSGDFTCDPNRGWYQTIIQSANNGEELRYQTLSNSFQLNLIGAHVALRPIKPIILGFQAYQASTEFEQNAVNQWFAPAARFPNQRIWQTWGSYIRMQNSWGEIRAEYALMPNRGHGFISQLRTVAGRLSMQPRFRFYSVHFENPFSGSYAADSEYQGIRQRNEAGVDIWLQWKPSAVLTLTSLTDAWFRPWIEDNVGAVQLDAAPPINATQKLQARLRRNQHSWQIAWQTSNKDLRHNGPTEHYYGSSGEDYGQGEKHKFSVAHTRQVNKVWRGKLTLEQILQSEGETRYGQESQLNLSVMGRMENSWRVQSVIGLRFSPVEDSGTYLYDRERPQLRLRQYVSRAMPKGKVFFTLGYDEYLEQRPERYPAYLFYRMKYSYQL
jgi:hypothetical protein